MHSRSIRGPEITYVTDEDLDIVEHQRILTEFVACANQFSLRVAFRIPAWSDTKMRSLVGWYSEHLAKQGIGRYLGDPLIHDRPEIVDQLPESRLWLPWRNRDLVRDIDRNRFAISIHSELQAEEATSLGARELIFGHVFTSESHPGEPGRGVSALNSVICQTETLPTHVRLTAIGGMNQYTLPELGRIGFGNVMAMRTISRARDIPLTLQLMHDSWLAARIAADLPDDQRSPLTRASNLFF